MSEANSLPRGHEHAGFEGPLLWLCHQRWTKLGCRLQGITKETIDDASDYFEIKQKPLRVVLNINDDADSEALVDHGHKMGEGGQWYIKNPHNYDDAMLCCDAEGVEQNLSKKSELTNPKPVSGTEFHFPDQGTMDKLDFAKISSSAKSVDEMISQLKLQGSSVGNSSPSTLADPSSPSTAAAAAATVLKPAGG